MLILSPSGFDEAYNEAARMQNHDVSHYKIINRIVQYVVFRGHRGMACGALLKVSGKSVK